MPPNQSAREISTLLLAIGAVGFSLEKPIQFKSGILAPVYTDNRCLPYHPQAWHRVIQGFVDLIHEKKLVYDVIAGIATAGIPHSAALSYHLQIPSIFIRKAEKEHGKQKRIEGGEVAGLRVLLVEDLVTTGGSSLDGVAVLREAGALVTDCLAITTYGFGEALANFAAQNVTLHTLTDFATTWEVAKAQAHLTPETVAAVEAWQNNPHEWGR